MATRESVHELMQQCEDALQYAREQLKEGNKQEHYNATEYLGAQQDLETAVNELERLSHSADGEQRERLHRMRLQLQQLQNEMIIKDN